MTDTDLVIVSNLYACRLIGVRSADDLKMQIELGLAGIAVIRRVRLDGVLLYEKLSTTDSDALASEIRDLLIGKSLFIRVAKELTSDSVRATVFYKDNDGELVSLNAYLIAKGYTNQTRGVIHEYQ